MLIDLSLTISEDLVTINGHPPVRFEAIDTHEKNKKSNTKVSFSIHSAGTHVDSPYHFFPNAMGIDQIPLDWLYRPGIKLDLTDKARAQTPITRADVEQAVSKVGENLADKIVILYTGWLDKMLGKPNYWGDNPFLLMEAAEWLASQKIRAIGLDFPPGKGAGNPAGMTMKGGSGDLHRLFLGNNILQIENLANLDKLPLKGFRIIAFPLKIKGGDGGPARVVAEVPDR